MAEQIFKELKTKIALKTLTYSQWDAIKDTYKPLRGEVCVCEIPTGATVPTANSVTPPTVLFKVGDGVNVWSALNWASALAADVYTWAKKPEAEFIAWVNEQIEHPVLSIVDPDAATKKFITEVEVSDHQVTITRSDVDWSDVKNAPDFALKSELPTELGVMSVKVTDDDVVIATPESATSGDVTIDVKHKEYNPATSDAVVDDLVPGADNGFTFVEPAVDKYGHVTGLTTHTVNYKIPEVHDGTLTLKAADGMVVETKTFTANDSDNVEFTVKHAAAATPAIVAGSGRTYVTAVHADDYGHVTGWETATETVVNTAHTHAVGAGLILGDVKGGIDGEVLTSLNIEFVDATNTDGKLKLVDKTSKEVLASFETANFVKDSFLESAVYDPTTHKITLGFIDNTDNKQDIEIDLTDLVNLYDADGETLVTMTDAPNGIDRFTFKIKDGGVGTTQLADYAVQTDKIADLNVTESKLDQDVQDALELARTALQESDVSTKANMVTDGTPGNFVSLDSDGDIRDAGCNASSFKTKQTAVNTKDLEGAKVLETLSQNANGEIEYTTRDLTPADIGAAPADNYLTVEAFKAADGESITVDDNGKIQLNSEIHVDSIKAKNDEDNGSITFSRNGVSIGSRYGVTITGGEYGRDVVIEGNGNNVKVSTPNGSNSGKFLYNEDEVATQVYVDNAIANSGHISEVVANNTDSKHSGLKVTDKNKIEIDDEVIFILNANF